MTNPKVVIERLQDVYFDPAVLKDAVDTIEYLQHQVEHLEDELQGYAEYATDLEVWNTELFKELERATKVIDGLLKSKKQ